MNKKIESLQFITPDIADKKVLSKLVSDICENGCRWVQLRLKNCSDNDFTDIGHSLRNITQKHNATLIINDRVHLVKEIHADGVHIGKNDTPVVEARKLLGNNKIIGATANTLQDCMLHIENKADYIGLGPYRFTTTKKELSPVLGIEGYKDIINNLAKPHPPIIAIGGIELADLNQLLRVNINRVAVSSAIVKNPQETVKWLQILGRL
jgi:thiamine-phosphate pyrophosphorylase